MDIFSNLQQAYDHRMPEEFEEYDCPFMFCDGGENCEHTEQEKEDYIQERKVLDRYDL